MIIIKVEILHHLSRWKLLSQVWASFNLDLTISFQQIFAVNAKNCVRELKIISCKNLRDSQSLLLNVLETLRVRVDLKRPIFIVAFFATRPICALISANICFASHSHRWCGLDFFLNSYAATRNRTCLGSCAPLWGTLIQDALPTALPWPRYLIGCLYAYKKGILWKFKAPIMTILYYSISLFMPVLQYDYSCNKDLKVFMKKCNW